MKTSTTRWLVNYKMQWQLKSRIANENHLYSICFTPADIMKEQYCYNMFLYSRNI